MSAIHLYWGTTKHSEITTLLANVKLLIPALLKSTENIT